MAWRDGELTEAYRRYGPAAFRRALALVGDRDEAWDVVHDVFERLARLEDPAAFRARPLAYVYRATTNASLNVLESQAVRRRPGNAWALGDPPRPGQDAAHAAALQARDLLYKLDSQLDALDRQIVVLQFMDGLSQDEIAEIVGVWRRTVGRRLARLRGLIESLGGGKDGGAP